MKNIVMILLFIILLGAGIYAQGSAGAGASIECESLIDMHTAGIIDKGNVGVNFYFMPMGVLMSRIEAGAFGNFSFGISYGASNFIGVGSPVWYKLPGVNLKLRIFEETAKTPAIAIGFDSQGKGEYYTKVEEKEVNRFKIKSPGFYAVFSKNYEFLGFMSFHGLVNYSLEKADGDKDLDLAFGFEKTIGSQVSIIAEYDFAINDNSKTALGDGSGYFNAGVRWSLGEGLTIGLDFRDLLSNKKVNAGSADRALRIDFIKPMFK